MSYRDPVELSFLASKKEKASALPPEWYQEIDGKRILRLLLCVGLNGTGKTKMIEALQYLRMLAVYKPEKPTDRPAYRPFLLDEQPPTGMIYGKLISVLVEEESSILAFSAASFRRCKAIGS